MLGFLISSLGIKHSLYKTSWDHLFYLLSSLRHRTFHSGIIACPGKGIFRGIFKNVACTGDRERTRGHQGEIQPWILLRRQVNQSRTCSRAASERASVEQWAQQLHRTGLGREWRWNNESAGNRLPSWSRDCVSRGQWTDEGEELRRNSSVFASVSPEKAGCMQIPGWRILLGSKWRLPRLRPC